MIQVLWVVFIFEFSLFDAGFRTQSSQNSGFVLFEDRVTSRNKLVVEINAAIKGNSGGNFRIQ